jgi:hypothetical protein
MNSTLQHCPMIYIAGSVPEIAHYMILVFTGFSGNWKRNYGL